MELDIDIYIRYFGGSFNPDKGFSRIWNAIAVCLDSYMMFKAVLSESKILKVFFDSVCKYYADPRESIKSRFIHVFMSSSHKSIYFLIC